jgi:hypothetical protein
VIARDHAVVVEVDPLHLLVYPVTHWDVEVADLPLVGHEVFGRMVESVFIMEDMLLQVVDAILIGLLGNSSVSLTVCNGLE